LSARPRPYLSSNHHPERLHLVDPALFGDDALLGENKSPVAWWMSIEEPLHDAQIVQGTASNGAADVTLPEGCD
jgi:hypothetical protein